MSRAPITEELFLPVEVAGRVWRLRAPYSPLAFHRHAELELNLALSGSATYLVGGQRVRLVRRTMLWLHPEQHHILIEMSSDFSMSIALWKPGFLARACQGKSSQILLQGDPGQARVQRLGEEAFAPLETLCLWLESASDEALDWGLGALLHGANDAFARADKNQINAVHPCVERAARLLRDSVPPPSLPELARQVGLSPSRLSRLFKMQTGVALGEFRARACHERALRLLESDLALGEVAVRAGFGSYAQFHRVFCRKSGVNPAKWRARVRP